MKERPIIFSAPMVRAILDGAKTQTRRIMKSQPISNNRGQFKFESATDWHNGMFWKSHCPYGKSGDRLWVREAWRIGAWDENRPALAIDYKADGFSRKKWLAVPDSGCDDFFERTWIQSSDDAEKAGLQKIQMANTIGKPVNLLAVGGLQSTCRAGHRAFSLRSPACAWSGCRI
jgi:hypothetical protein